RSKTYERVEQEFVACPRQLAPRWVDRKATAEQTRLHAYFKTSSRDKRIERCVTKDPKRNHDYEQRINIRRMQCIRLRYATTHHNNAITNQRIQQKRNRQQEEGIEHECGREVTVNDLVHGSSGDTTRTG